MHPIYLDFAAATPADEQVNAAMVPFWSQQFYNPSSSYMAARHVRTALADARARVAHWLGARPTEVIFTAGATESINLAIRGAATPYADAEIITSAIEHESVLAAARQYKLVVVPVTKDGLVQASDIKSRLTDKTVVVSIGYANNEIGTIQHMRAIAEVIRAEREVRRLRNNPRPLYLHTDASQAACYLDLHASRLGVDMLTLNGGKMYGPKQTGVLFIKTGVRISPLIVGGGQEGGMRSGTENVAGAVGLATALDIAQSQRQQAGEKIASLRNRLQDILVDALPDTHVNGSLKKRLPNNLHVSWPSIDGERLLMALDENGLMASTGSACAANKGTASHVLQAIGCEPEYIQGSLRLTLGRTTTQQDVAMAAQRIIAAVRAQQQGGSNG